MSKPTPDLRSSKAVTEVDDATFGGSVLSSPIPVLVDFTAVWCAPCRVIVPHLEAVATQYAGRLRVVKCDVDENHATAARYDVRAMPTLLLFHRGAVVGQLVGAVPRARIEALVEPVLRRLPEGERDQARATSA